MDRGPELCFDILHLSIRNLIIGVERDIDHDQRNVQLFGEVLVPFDHAVADVVAAEQKIRLGHVLLRSILDLGVSQADTGIRTDIIGIAVCFTYFTQTGAAAACSNAGSLVFRVNDGQAQCFRDLYREIAGAPANHLAAFFGFLCIRVSLGCDLAQLVLGRIGIWWRAVLFDIFRHNVNPP